MLLGTRRTQRAEAAIIVVGTWRQLAARVYVQVHALVTIAAIAIAHEKIALGHLAQVVFVEKLASITFFAKAAQPVLTDEVAKAFAASMAIAVTVAVLVAVFLFGRRRSCRGSSSGKVTIGTA